MFDVLFRVPPLFVIDELLKNMGTSPTATVPNNLWNDTAETPVISYPHFQVLLYSSFNFILAGIGCLASLCIFMLWPRNLIRVYLHLFCLGCIYLSYRINNSFLQDLIMVMADEQNSEYSEFRPVPSMTFYQTFGLQLLLSFLFSSVYVLIGVPRHHKVHRFLPLFFIGPLVPVSLPSSAVEYAPVLATLVPLILAQFVVWVATVPAVQTLNSGYHHVHNMLSNFGMATFVETEWTRLNVPCVLLTFWLLRVAEHTAVLIKDHLDSGDANMPLAALIFDMAKSLLVTGCDTLTAVLGMTSVVSYLCYYMGCLFQWALLTEDEEKPLGTVSAMIFYILALQAGLTSCDPDKRLVRLGRNFCLLFTALLHFVHNYVHPLLLSLSASHNPALHRHLRALGVCVFLILFPITLLVNLWSHHSISTWLLAVSAFSIEVIVKVMVSLMIYSLFLLDAYRSTFWEKLDDYVYYIQAFGHVVEFSFGFLLFMNSAWVLIFEAGGAVRAVMVGIHAYFNIWCDAQAGWRVFMKRRTAVNKINSLPEATSEQLQELNDVCSICYQDMRSAKITRCNHFFHGVCLRKWLYVQDRCPLCHDVLYRVSSQEQISE